MVSNTELIYRLIELLLVTCHHLSASPSPALAPHLQQEHDAMKLEGSFKSLIAVQLNLKLNLQLP